MRCGGVCRGVYAVYAVWRWCGGWVGGWGGVVAVCLYLFSFCTRCVRGVYAVQRGVVYAVWWLLASFFQRCAEVLC